MLIRYTKNTEGKLTRKAKVYAQEEHGIDLNQIDPQALFITRRLQLAGFEAYIVGGAIRDLLLNRKPKDFDVVTNAKPQTIKKIFPSSYIIGRRFRLVHVYFSQDKFIEVSTFRSDCANVGNVFGTIEQDVKRRDFSVNALYYSPARQCLIDQVEGMNDIRKKRLCNVIHLKDIFHDDPVRMVRAVKYSILTGLHLSWPLSFQMRKDASYLAKASTSRLTEEFFKILHCGSAEKIFLQLKKYRLLSILLPHFCSFFHPPFFHRVSDIQRGVRLLDKQVSQGKILTRGEALTYIIIPWLESQGWSKKAKTEDFESIIQDIRHLFKPVIPSQKELEMLLREFFRVWSIRPPAKRSSYRKHPEASLEKG